MSLFYYVAFLPGITIWFQIIDPDMVYRTILKGLEIP